MPTTMDRGIIDLNLNCSPCNASINEEIRQVMINHEIIFREQLTELHRLYWTQKNLMHGLYTQNSYHKSIAVRSNSNSDMKNYLLSSINWVRNNFEIGESSYGTKNVRNLIDLEKKPINLESEQEEDEVVCLSEYEIGKCLVDSTSGGAYLDYKKNSKSEFYTQFSEQTHEIIGLDPNTHNNNAPVKLPLQIDLNVAQNDDPTYYQPDPIKQSESLNGSSKGSSITRHAHLSTIFASENQDPQIKLPNLNVKEEEEEEEEEEEDTISSHVLTGGEELETDSNVTFAAETLLSIRSEKSEMIGVSSDCASEDSFVIATLNILEETKDDATWKSLEKRKIENNGEQNENKINNTRRINLRRGRGLRDFQRDVLPGLVSLSRNEICEDLHAIGFEVRKNRYRRNHGKDGWTVTGKRGGTRKTRRRRR